MKELFNQPVNRKNCFSVKWDKQESSNCLPFWVADSDYQTAPCIIEALQKRVALGHFGYSYYPNAYYESIISWYQLRYSVNLEKEWIVPITGVVLALKIAIDSATTPQAEVVIQTPVYHQFNRAISESNRNIAINKLIKQGTDYTMDLSDLEKRLQEGAKMVILCNPHNPVGRVWRMEELRALAALCEAYDVYLVSDEIHGDLIMPDYEFTSMLHVTDYAKLIVLSAPSKTFNIAGLESSFAIIRNEDVRKTYENQMHDYFLPHVSVFGVVATISGYTEGAPWVDAQNQHIFENYQYLVNYLNTELPNVQIAPLEGTYLAWLDLTYLHLSSEEIVKELSLGGVTVNNGKQFGSDYNGFIRFNLACSKDQLQEGINRFCRIIKKISE